MPSERINKLKNIGLDLSKSLSTGGRDGFTKWANRLTEISNFIKTKGYYPKSSGNKEEALFYQSLARTKRAFKNNELSDRHLELIRKLNIDLE